MKKLGVEYEKSREKSDKSFNNAYSKIQKKVKNWE